MVVGLATDAEAAARAGRPDQAAEQIERALRIEPRNPRLWHRLAEIRLSTGEYGQAVQLAAKSNSLAGSDRALRADNWHLIATAYELSGDVAGARRARDKASELQR